MSTVRYEVRCQEGVAQEMARYESGYIVGAADPEEPDGPADELTVLLTTRLYTIESPAVNTRRWASFGCTPKRVHSAGGRRPSRRTE